LIERLVEDKHLIVLLNNTGGTKLDEMSQNIRKILYSEPHKEPQRPISQLLYKTILERGVGSAVNQYWELKANQPEVYDFGEFELEFVGRHLLKIKKNMEAIEILKLNVESHPKIPMVFDSLGDAYRASGKKELAIKNYTKALELDPNNRNLAEKIRNLTNR
jgi:tetratricopeptide (TPR) repeat protein